MALGLANTGVVRITERELGCYQLCMHDRVNAWSANKACVHEFAANVRGVNGRIFSIGNLADFMSEASWARREEPKTALIVSALRLLT